MHTQRESSSSTLTFRSTAHGQPADASRSLAPFLLTMVLMLSPVTRASAGEPVTPCGSDSSILETATLGPTGQGAAGANIDDLQYLGAKFEVVSASRILAVGGHLVNATPGQEIFVAVVPLDPIIDLPASFDLADAEFVALVEPASPSDELTLCVDFILEPGRYGLVFGSSLFGATATANMPLVDTSIGKPEYFRAALYDPEFPVWEDLPSNSLPNRLFVFGETGGTDSGGFPHFAVGNAQLDSLSQTSLRVSNIGSSGQDGVTIGTRQALSWGGSISSVETAGRLSATAIANIDGVPDQMAAAIALEDDGNDGLNLSADFPTNGGAPLAFEISSGNSSVGVANFSQNQTVGVRCYLDGIPWGCSSLFLLFDLDLGFLRGHSFCQWGFGFYRPDELQSGPSKTGGAPTFEVTIGENTWTGDRISVRTIPGEEPGPYVAFTSQIELLSSDTTSFVLSNETTLDLKFFEDGFESGDFSAWTSAVGN